MDMDQILSDMRQHISSLQEKLTVANLAVNKGHNVNEKINLMKEYQDKVASLNSCWRARNRTQLVSNLQQESRQIIALEEENRQLRYALKEMEDGLHLVMNDYRKVLSGFMRAESLMDAADSQNKQTFIAGVEYDRYFGIARAAESFMSLADQKISNDEALITQLRVENQTLRGILHGSPLISIPEQIRHSEPEEIKEDKDANAS